MRDLAFTCQLGSHTVAFTRVSAHFTLLRGFLFSFRGLPYVKAHHTFRGPLLPVLISHPARSDSPNGSGAGGPTSRRGRPSGIREKESCQENVSQVRKHVLLTINPELIHATLEAIRYTRRTVRGICAADTREKRKRPQKRKEKRGRADGSSSSSSREDMSERESEKCVIS